MLTIQEIRQKYPQYKDMPDQQLVDALHQKYYSDMPAQEFYQKVGFQPNQQAQPVQSQQTAQPEQPVQNPQAQPQELSLMDKFNNFVKASSEMNPIMQLFHANLQAQENIPKAADVVGNKVQEGATALGAPPEVAGGLGTAANVGVQAIPMLAGGEAGKTVKGVEKSANWLMKGALAPTIEATKAGDAAVATKTMLEKNIPLSEKGLDILKQNIADLNTTIKSAIAKNQGTVPVKDLEASFASSMKKYGNRPLSDIKAIRSEWQDFMNHPMIAGKTEIPVQDAQALKTGFQQAVNSRYGQQAAVTDEAQKSIAYALRGSVAKVAPDVVPLNAEERKMLQTFGVAQRKVIIAARQNPAGLAAFAIRHPVEFAAGMADRNAQFRAWVARLLYQGKKQIPATAARVGIAGGPIAYDQLNK